MNIDDRVQEIESSGLAKRLPRALSTWTFKRDTLRMKTASLYVIGSVLTNNFEPGESDLDIAIGTAVEPGKLTKEYFWQEFPLSDMNDQLVAELDFNCTQIDCCRVFRFDELETRLEDPHYALTP